MKIRGFANNILNIYWLGMFSAGVITACLLFLFSSMVDPYHFFGRGGIESKPTIHENLRFHKTYQVKKIQPSVVLLGSSRVYHGLDPSSSSIVGGGVVYNMAVPVCRISEIAAFIEHVNNVSKVDEVIIGLDFLSFDVLQTSIDGMPWSSLYGDGHVPSLSTYLSDILKSSASIKSVVDAIKTIFDSEGEWDFYHENGFLVQDYFDEKIAHVGGYYKAMSYYIDNGLPYSKGEFENYILFGSTLEGPFAKFREIIKYAHAHEIKLKLFISPIHAVQLEYMEAVGSKDVYDKWRKKLVDVIEEIHGFDGDLKLWDFSGYNSITTEAIPEKNDENSSMYYFLDASHYKKVTGDLILEKILDITIADNYAGSKFGETITSKNFPGYLRQEQDARLKFFRNDLNQYRIYKSMLAAKNINMDIQGLYE